MTLDPALPRSVTSPETRNAEMIGADSLNAFGADGVPALRRSSLAEAAAASLREWILLERLPAGLALNERKLAEVLGISRTPVREAIRQLQSEGLVEVSPTRRPRVADPSMTTLSQWLMVQGALEGLAGEQACRLASDAELAAIASIQDRMIGLVGCGDRMQVFQLDMEFHRTIVAAAHNPPLQETHEQYNARLWRARFISSQRRANRATQMRKHQDIVDALQNRDAATAAAALRAHLLNAVSNIRLAIRERRECPAD